MQTRVKVNVVYLFYIHLWNKFNTTLTNHFCCKKCFANVTRVSRGSQSPSHFTCYGCLLSPGTCSEWCVLMWILLLHSDFSIFFCFKTIGGRDSNCYKCVDMFVCQFFCSIFQGWIYSSFFRILNCVSDKIYLIATHSKPQGIYHDHFTCILYSFDIHVED